MRNKGFTLIELVIVIAILASITAIALPNVLRSRMAANEAAAIAACKTFCTAEDIYRRTDYKGDGVLQYAQRLSGADSLFATSGPRSRAAAGATGLIDSAFALAEGDPVFTPAPLATGKAIAAREGYVFWILAQYDTPAIAVSYFDINGYMTLGFAFSAAPNQYDITGRNCFQVNTDGTIYQADLRFTGHRNSYNLNASGVPWLPVQ